jgi:nucleoside-diphosphate-sugar epimerase
MRIFVAGGTGVIGRPLVARLLADGHEVSVLTRSSDSAAAARAAGAEPVMGDATDPDDLRTAVIGANPEVVVNQLTSLSQSTKARELRAGVEATGRLRAEVAPRLVAAAVEAGAHRVVAQSIAFVYAPASGAPPRTEDDPLYTDGPGELPSMVQAVTALERATLGGDGVEGVVLRYGTFYGPGTYYGPGGAFAELVRRRRLPVPGAGGGLFGFVHVDDAVSATVRALTGPTGTYNVADDHPAPAAEWIPFLAQLLGARPPRRVPEWAARLAAGAAATYLMCHQPAVSSARARERLGWAPAHDDWREGLRVAFA